MTIREEIKSFEIDNNQQLKHLKFKHFPVWLNLRNHYWAKKFKSYTETYTSLNLKSKIKYFFNIFYGCTNWTKKYDVWIFSSTLTKRFIDGKYIDVFFEAVTDKFNARALVFELPVFEHFPKKQQKHNYIVSRLPLVIFEQIWVKINTFSNYYKKIINEIHQTLNPDILSGIPLSYSVQKTYIQYKVMQFLLKILPNPQYVFILPSYTHYGYIKAIKEKGIKVIEMQHGVINAEHYGYNLFFDKLSSEFFPDYLLTFGETEKNAIQTGDNLWGKGTTKFVPVGSFMIDYYIKSFKKDSELSKLSESYDLSIAVALQDCEIGIKFFEKLITIAQEHPSLLFLVKRRKKEFQWYQNNYSWPSNIHFIEKLNIYNVILNADMHLTAYSTTAIEAPALGKPNILYNLENKARNYYGNKLTENFNTFYFLTKKEFTDAIKTWKDNPISSKTIMEEQKNIIPGYQQNISKFLTSLSYK